MRTLTAAALAFASACRGEDSAAPPADGVPPALLRASQVQLWAPALHTVPSGASFLAPLGAPLDSDALLGTAAVYLAEQLRGMAAAYTSAAAQEDAASVAAAAAALHPGALALTLRSAAGSAVHREDGERGQPVIGSRFWVEVDEGASPLHAAAGCSMSVADDAAVEDATVASHKLVLQVGPLGEAFVLTHTYQALGRSLWACPASASAPSPSPSSPSSSSSSLRLVSFNLWNSNPPRWLWPDGRDRWRQYSLRMLHVGDTLRAIGTTRGGSSSGVANETTTAAALQAALAGLDVIAFQEVRYDTSLGGWAPGTGAHNSDSPVAAAEKTASWARLQADAAAAASGGSGGCKEEAATAPPADTVTVGPDGEVAASPAPRACTPSSSEADPEAPFDDDVPPSRNAPNVPYTHRSAALVAAMWHNITRGFLSHPVYVDKWKKKAGAVTQAPGFAALQRAAVASGAFGAALGHHSSADDAMDTSETPQPVPTLGVPPAAPTAPPRRVRAATLRRPFSQLSHLLPHLPGFQFVHHPAHSYGAGDHPHQSHAPDVPAVDEEGPAIFSRYPIVGSDALLLSRDPDDGDDGHQRLCLHAAIAVTPDLTVDVYTVHLALSPRARRRSVVELASFIASTSRGRLYLLAGDMNAEPQEDAMKALVADVDEAVHEVVGENEGKTPLPLADAWTALHPEPSPRDDDPAVRRLAFTFPCDDPVKRIDMIFGGSAEPAGEGHLRRVALAGCNTTAAAAAPARPCVARAFLAGQDPVPGTDRFEGTAGIGMTSIQSPVFASDHRALVVDIQL